ncbi:MAG: hypothetical protein JWP91_2492 [Fibrobacteres bacterium]|nr:hypothetical protein [Fibrobacterota bacterium]
MFNRMFFQSKRCGVESVRNVIVTAGWALAIMAPIACTTATPIRIPDPVRWEHVSGRIHIVTDEGEIATDSLLVRDDTAYFEGKAVPLSAIRKIEKRTVSVPRTFGVAALGLAGLSLALGTMLYLITVFGRGSR